MKELTDLLNAPGGQEIVAAGIGAIIGTAHAVYSVKRHKKKQFSEYVSLIVSAGVMGTFISNDTSNPFLIFRSMIDGPLAGISYVMVYNRMYEFLTYCQKYQKDE